MHMDGPVPLLLLSSCSAYKYAFDKGSNFSPRQLPHDSTDSHTSISYKRTCVQGSNKATVVKHIGNDKNLS